MKARTAFSEKSTLVADIGGTNARFASVDSDHQGLSNLMEYACKDFDNIDAALHHYLDQPDIARPEKICLAVPGPVEQDRITLVNSHWTFSQKALSETMQLPLRCINDFDAQAYYVRQIDNTEVQWLDHHPDGPVKGMRLVLGAGTGLGVSAIMPSGELVPSEGGHIAFAPINAHQNELLQLLQRRFPRVSVERFLSGPGLENLYWANSLIHGDERQLSAPEITSALNAKDPVALACVNDFFDILAAVAGDLALAMGAWSAVYMTGGVTPRLYNHIDVERFRNTFSNKGRFESLCRQTPIALVTAEQPGLKGCALAD
ncbi:glucokinase [Pseudoteredinibacter isoporae]|uniref:glucokinase n=1 Tax=Pseudoteredinibacter isoporae TaxID=570281 RepID=UPI00310C5353